MVSVYFIFSFHFEIKIDQIRSEERQPIFEFLEYPKGPSAVPLCPLGRNHLHLHLVFFFNRISFYQNLKVKVIRTYISEPLAADMIAFHLPQWVHVSIGMNLKSLNRIPCSMFQRERKLLKVSTSSDQLL